MMSKFFSRKPGELKAYVPGEQPRNVQQLIKLNTNESPFPPAPEVIDAVAAAAQKANLYCDPTMLKLREDLASIYGYTPDYFTLGNGSDELLSFAFLAFCNKEIGAAYADITYGFYSVFANLHGSDYTEIPLKADFTIDVDKFCEENNLNAKIDDSFILDTVRRVIGENDKAVADYKSGKTKAMQSLFGCVMKELRGNGSPDVIREMLEAELNK